MESKKVAILTALGVEFEAAAQHFEFESEVEDPITGAVYDHGTFGAREKSWEVYLAEIGPGNANASNVAARCIDFIKPDLIVFLGVAGGVKDVKVCDVVIGTKVYGYESGKDEEKFKTRPSVFSSSERVLNRARAVRRRKEWLNRIKVELLPEEIPEAFVAPIAAGEKVVGSTESESFQLIKSSYGDSLAVEMEGHGFLAGTHSRDNTFCVVIRGISDLVDGKAEADASGSQEKASHTAAAFCFELLENLNLPSRQNQLPSNNGENSESSAKKAMETQPPQITPADYIPGDVKETLYSNLLPFESFPSRVYMSECRFTSVHDLFEHLKENGISIPRDWVLHGKMIITPNDLREEIWETICDQSSYEEQSFDEWAESVDIRTRNHLLYTCLKRKLYLLGVRYNSKLSVFYFVPKKSLRPIKMKYMSIRKKAERTVFQGYQQKKDSKNFEYYRHLAAELDIVEISGQLYLAVNPTHYFTSDGYQCHSNYVSKLKGMKKMERNRTILNSNYFWAQLLSKKHRRNSKKHYPHLSFGPVVTVELDKGFDEKDWGAIS